MNVLDPVVVGVPEMIPVDAASDNPAGKVPDVTENVYGDMPPDAAISVNELIVKTLSIPVVVNAALLVPALMALLGRANWWAPRRLRPLCSRAWIHPADVVRRRIAADHAAAPVPPRV